MHATPIPTFYNIALFLHMKDKLKLNVRPSTWITPKLTSTLGDQWKEMIEDERNMLCLKWAMNWEEFENDMHLAYLVGSILTRIILAYFWIVKFEKTSRSIQPEQPKVDLDIVVPKERIEIEVDDEFDPLFSKSRSLPQHLKEQLLK